ncbi:hypothetical protein C8R45DRAFT_1102170 [Mycena sanguinolenta]|nr:hypothetical protein C8R45DRAFT_1102170 [Mycena sanguinolenta]
MSLSPLVPSSPPPQLPTPSLLRCSAVPYLARLPDTPLFLVAPGGQPNLDDEPAHRRSKNSSSRRFVRSRARCDGGACVDFEVDATHSGRPRARLGGSTRYSRIGRSFDEQYQRGLASWYLRTSRYLPARPTCNARFRPALSMSVHALLPVRAAHLINGVLARSPWDEIFRSPSPNQWQLHGIAKWRLSESPPTFPCTGPPFIRLSDDVSARPRSRLPRELDLELFSVVGCQLQTFRT